MCGIIGAVNFSKYASHDQQKFFSDAVVAGTVRGTDGFGVFQVDKKQAVFSDKQVQAAPYLFSLEKSNIKNIVNDVAACKITVGHHRAATQGVISRDNAHPFYGVDRDTGEALIVGVHNGSLVDWGQDKEAKQFEVDSDWLIHKIANDGDKALEEISGPIATVWYDYRKPDRLFMYRNYQRPLHFVRMSTEKFLIASEAEMLYWLIKRHKISTIDKEILECRPEYLYTLDGKSTNGFTCTKIERKYKQASTGNFWSNHSSNKSVSDLDDDDEEALRKLFGAAPTSYYTRNYRDVNAELERIVKEVLAEPVSEQPVVESKALTVVNTTQPTVSTRPVRASKEEHDLLFSLLEIKPGTEVVFEAVIHEDTAPDMVTLYGQCLIETDAEGNITREYVDALIRSLPKKIATEYTDRKVPVLCRAIGARLERRPDGKGLDPVVLLTPSPVSAVV